MADNNENLQQDIDLTEAIKEVLNGFPGIESGEKIRFNALDENGGKAFFPTGGAVITTDRKDVLGRHWQTCAYPFA